MPIFMKIEGIQGDSTYPGSELQHDISSYSWGVSNPTLERGGTGKASFSDLSVMVHTGRAAPDFMFHCAQGTHFPKAILTCRKGGDGQPYLVITLEDVLISSFHVGGDGGDTQPPLGALSFSYSKIEYKVYYSKADGSTAISKKYWDLKENKGG